MTRWGAAAAYDLGGQVGVGHLSPGVHSGVGASGAGEPYAQLAQHRREGVLDDALHGSLARLDGPSGEVGAVIGQVDADADEPALPRGVGGLDRASRGRQRQDSFFASSAASSAISANASASPAASSTAGSSLGVGDIGCLLGGLACLGSGDLGTLDVTLSSVVGGFLGCCLGCLGGRGDLGRGLLGRSLLGGPPGGCLGLAHRLDLGREGLDELDHGHRRVVALARPHLGDAGVAAVAVLVPRADLGEQLVHDALVTDDREHPATRVQVTALGEGDEAFGQRTQPLGLGLGRGDPAVLEQRGGEVRQHEPLVGRSAAEARSLGGGRHGCCSPVVFVWASSAPTGCRAPVRGLSTARPPRKPCRRRRRSCRRRCWGRTRAGCP